MPGSAPSITAGVGFQATPTTSQTSSQDAFFQQLQDLQNQNLATQVKLAGINLDYSGKSGATHAANDAAKDRVQ
jgi:hypothetical protein